MREFAGLVPPFGYNEGAFLEEQPATGRGFLMWNKVFGGEMSRGDYFAHTLIGCFLCFNFVVLFLVYLLVFGSTPDTPTASIWAVRLLLSGVQIAQVLYFFSCMAKRLRHAGKSKATAVAFLVIYALLVVSALLNPENILGAGVVMWLIGSVFWLTVGCKKPKPEPFVYGRD